MPALDPKAHPALLDLASRLRELAGDSAYGAGREYFRKGLVKQGAVAGTTAYASVSGSTDYRVSIAIGDQVKVTCTCPAHRRNKHCKHVVSVCVALVERPGDFPVGEAPPEVAKPSPKRATRSRTSADPRGEERADAPSQAELRSAGMETVDRLVQELAASGVVGLGRDKVTLLAEAGELVRALKLRRLGNLLMTLQRAAEDGPQQVDEMAFARLVSDLYLTHRVTGACLAGQAQIDEQMAEDLVGKTWRDEELELVTGIDLMEVAFTRRDDGEFRIQTSYLAEVTAGTIYAEKSITPSRLYAEEKASHRHLLHADEARLYPGEEPRRLRLSRVRRAPLAAGDVGRFVARVPDSVAELRRMLVERLAVPFGAAELAVAFRPLALGVHGAQSAAVDSEGRVLLLDAPPKWLERLVPLLPGPGEYALFGHLALTGGGLTLQCLSAVSATFAWPDGPVYS